MKTVKCWVEAYSFERQVKCEVQSVTGHRSGPNSLGTTHAFLFSSTTLPFRALFQVDDVDDVGNDSDEHLTQLGGNSG